MSNLFNVGTSSVHPTPMQNDTNKGGDEVREDSDEDESENSDAVLQEDGMQVAAQHLDMTPTRMRVCKTIMNM